MLGRCLGRGMVMTPPTFGRHASRRRVGAVGTSRTCTAISGKWDFASEWSCEYSWDVGSLFRARYGHDTTHVWMPRAKAARGRCVRAISGISLRSGRVNTSGMWGCCLGRGMVIVSPAFGCHAPRRRGYVAYGDKRDFASERSCEYSWDMGSLFRARYGHDAVFGCHAPRWRVVARVRRARGCRVEPMR